jgi:hypothetical protein
MQGHSFHCAHWKNECCGLLKSLHDAMVWRGVTDEKDESETTATAPAIQTGNKITELRSRRR